MARAKGYRRPKKYKKTSRKYQRARKGHRAHRLNWLRDRYSKRNEHYTRGALHKHYGYRLGEEIPIKLLIRDQHKPGKLGYQVRFALGRRGYYSKK